LQHKLGVQKRSTLRQVVLSPSPPPAFVAAMLNACTGAYALNSDCCGFIGNHSDDGYFSRTARDRANVHMYRHPYLIMCYMFGCFRIAYGNSKHQQNELRERASSLLSFGRENLTACMEARRLELGGNHVEVLRMLSETSGDLASSLAVQQGALGRDHIVCLETEIEIAKREHELNWTTRKAVCTPSGLCCGAGTWNAMDRDLGNMLCTDARLFKIQKKTLGALHPHTLRTVLSLALSVESRHGAQWAIQKLERSLGVQHVLCTEARELILRSRSDGSLRNLTLMA